MRFPANPAALTREGDKLQHFLGRRGDDFDDETTTRVCDRYRTIRAIQYTSLALVCGCHVHNVANIGGSDLAQVRNAKNSCIYLNFKNKKKIVIFRSKFPSGAEPEVFGLWDALWFCYSGLFKQGTPFNARTGNNFK